MTRHRPRPRANTRPLYPAPTSSHHKVEPALQPAELRNPLHQSTGLNRCSVSRFPLRRFDETLLMSAWMLQPARAARPARRPAGHRQVDLCPGLASRVVLRGGEHINIDLSSMRSHNEGLG